MVVYFSFQVKIGKNVATTKEQNSKDRETNIGKKSRGNIIPTRIDFEKSGPVSYTHLTLPTTGSV